MNAPGTSKIPFARRAALPLALAVALAIAAWAVSFAQMPAALADDANAQANGAVALAGDAGARADGAVVAATRAVSAEAGALAAGSLTAQADASDSTSTDGSADGSGDASDSESADANPLAKAEVVLDHPGVFPYTGFAWKPSFTVKLGDKTLVEGTDYVEPDDDGPYKFKGFYQDVTPEAESVLIRVKGIGEYADGLAETKFEVKKLNLKGSKSSFYIGSPTTMPTTTAPAIEGVVFQGTGIEHKPDVILAWYNSTDKKYFQVSEEAYEAPVYSDNTAVGTGKVKITAKIQAHEDDEEGISADKQEWVGTVEKTFRIGYDISKAKVQLLDADGKEIAEGAEFTYTGSAIKPDKIIVHASGSIEGDGSSDGQGGSNAGGEGDSAGDQGGSGAAGNGGQGQSTSGENNAGAGEDGSSTGTADSGSTSEGGSATTDEGSPSGSGGTTTDDDALKITTDYTVSYATTNSSESSSTSPACKGVGTITVSINGAGNYVGTAKRMYKIVQKSIADDDVTVSGLDPRNYTGSALEPSLTVKYKDNTLSEPYTYYIWSSAGDYTVEYAKNTNPGTATVTIKAVESGNYKGERTVHFTINDVGKVPTLKATDRGSGIVTLTWNNIFNNTTSSKVDAFEVRWKNAKGKWVTKFKSTTNSTTASNLACKRAHSFQVRAYANGAWQGWSNVASVKPTGATKPVNLHAVSSGKTSIRLSWDSVPGASKYEILEKSGNGKFTSRTSEFTSNVANIPGLKKKGKYTYAVRAYVEGKWAKCSKKAYVKVSPADAAPAVVTAKSTGAGKVKLTWKKVRNAKKYWVQYRGNDGKWKTCTKKLKKRKYTVKNLKTGYYTFRVRAYANGKWSPKYDEYNTYMIVYGS